MAWRPPRSDDVTALDECEGRPPDGASAADDDAYYLRSNYDVDMRLCERVSIYDYCCCHPRPSLRMRTIVTDPVAWSVGLSHCRAKTAEPIEMLFGLRTLVGPGNHVLDGGPNPPWEGAIFGGKGRSL